MKQLPIIFACSHHRGGNSDHAAAVFLEGVRQAGGDAEIITLGEMDFMHCIGCLKCRTTKDHRCIFADSDKAQELYEKIMKAPFTFFSAPIYFYHLPSRLKTFIDRGQWAFEAMNCESAMKSLPVRPAYACFVAGRPKGEKLFEGSQLSLKFFLRFFKAELEEPLTFKGIDMPDDLENDLRACREINEAGVAAWKRSIENGC